MSPLVVAWHPAADGRSSSSHRRPGHLPPPARRPIHLGTCARHPGWCPASGTWRDHWWHQGLRFRWAEGAFPAKTNSGARGKLAPCEYRRDESICPPQGAGWPVRRATRRRQPPTAQTIALKIAARNRTMPPFMTSAIPDAKAAALAATSLFPARATTAAKASSRAIGPATATERATRTACRHRLCTQARTATTTAPTETKDNANNVSPMAAIRESAQPVFANGDYRNPAAMLCET
jgi:hypothetical protein